MRRTTRSSAATGLSPAATARASSSATVGNSCRISRSRWVTWAVSRFSRRSTPSTNAITQKISSGTERSGDAAATRPDGTATTANATSPQTTCSTRNCCDVHLEAGALEPASHRRGSAEHALDSARRAPTSPGPKTPAKAFGRRHRRGQCVRTRQVADVGQHPHRERRTTRIEHRGRDQPGTQAERRSEQGTDEQGHDRIRLSVGQPADAHHHPVGEGTQARSADQHDDSGARGVALDHLGLEAHQQQHQPGRGHGQPGAVDRPRLARLELGAGPGVVAQEAGEAAQQSAEVTTADLARHAQALHDPVTHRVGQPVLEPVERVAEACR